jgi:hypothetical protein
MANLSFDAVDKFKKWLSVPAEDEERSAYQGAIEQLSPQFGSLVFEDDKWFEYDNDRIVRILQRPGQEWLTDDEVTRLENATLYGTLDSFLPWFKEIVEGWEAGERGTGPASAGEAVSQVLGIENPNYASYPLVLPAVPGAYGGLDQLRQRPRRKNIELPVLASLPGRRQRVGVTAKTIIQNGGRPARPRHLRHRKDHGHAQIRLDRCAGRADALPRRRGVPRRVRRRAR